MVPSSDSEPWIAAEIREQGEVLARVDQRVRPLSVALTARPPKRLHLVGCGDMYFAAAQTRALAAALWGLEIRAWRSMDLRWVGARLGPNDRVVCASVSGRTPRTLEAVHLARRAGAEVLVLTDNADSPLAKAAPDGVVLEAAPPEKIQRHGFAGYQRSIPQTKTFLAVLYAELLLGAAAVHGEDSLRSIPPFVGRVSSDLEPRGKTIPEALFPACETIAILGSGPHRPLARYGAAKMLEYALPALAQCLEEYNHLEVFVADRRTRIIVLAADSLSAQRALELTAAWERLGVKSLVLANRDGFPGKWTRTWVLPGSNLLEHVFAEAIALEWLACGAAVALKRDPNQWLGGRRTELLQSLSETTIRGSKALTRPEAGAE